MRLNARAVELFPKFLGLRVLAGFPFRAGSVKRAWLVDVISSFDCMPHLCSMKRAVFMCLAVAVSITAALAQEWTLQEWTLQEWTLAGATWPGRYVTGDARCGAALYDYPRLRIGMRAGTCAGLAASRD